MSRQAKTLILVFGPILGLVFLISEYSPIEESGQRQISESVTQAAEGPPESVQVSGCEIENGMQRRIHVDELHEYLCFVEASHYVEFVVEQHDVDVALSILDSNGEKLVRVDSPNGRNGPEQLVIVLDSAGLYQFQIRALQPVKSMGYYSVDRYSLRPATDNDRLRSSAHVLFAEAEEARRRVDKDSLTLAIELYMAALSTWRELGEEEKAAFTVLRIGNVYSKLGQFEEALVFYKQLVQIYSGLNDISKTVEALNNVGAIHRQLGDHAQAQRAYEQALELLGGAEEPEIRASLLNNLGMVSARLGRPFWASRYYREALSISQRYELSKRRAIVLSNLGKLYSSLSETDLARDYLEQSLELWTQIEAGGEGRAIVLGNLGSMYEELGDLERAERFHLEALAVFNKLRDRIRAARILGNLGRIYRHLPGSLEKAETSYHQLLETARRAGDRYSEGIALANLGWLFSLKDPARALGFHEQAIMLFEAVKSAPDRTNALHGMAVTLRNIGRLAEAEALILQALDQAENLRNDVSEEEMRLAYFANRQKLYGFAVSLLIERDRCEPAVGHLERAFAVSQRARARGLLDALEAPLNALRHRADPKLLAREMALRAEIDANESASWSDAAMASMAQELHEGSRRVRRLISELHDVETQIRFDLGQQLGWAEPLELAEIRRQLLDDETVLLQYDLDHSESFLWLLTPQQLEVFKLPGEPVIDQQVERLRTLLTRSHERLAIEPLSRARAEMSRMLLGPVHHRLDGKKLLIVVEGSLESIPFALLKAPLREECRRAPMLVGQEITMIPSASVAVALSSPDSTQVGPMRVAVVADPVFVLDDPRIDAQNSSKPESGRVNGSGNLGSQLPTTEYRGLPNFRRLPASATEARAILDMVSEERRLGVLGFEANRETVISGSLADFDILHFATHGWLHPQYPELSGLVLSQVDERGDSRSGFLRLQEISALDLSAELVVLSACSTALGREIAGEGVVGLARAFLLAGARRVIVSLWKVDDFATAELMAGFYRHLLRRELSPASALRSAQLELAGQQRWSAPYFWSGFVLQGSS